MNTAKQVVKNSASPKKYYPFFASVLIEETSLPAELIDIIAGYLIGKKPTKPSLYHEYFDFCYQFDVITENDHFYILPVLRRNYILDLADHDNSLSERYTMAIREVIHGKYNSWLRFINTFTDNAFIFLNRKLFSNFKYLIKLFLPTNRFGNLLDSAINIATKYRDIPGLMYLKLLDDQKLFGYFISRDNAKDSWSTKEYKDLEDFFAWIKDDSVQREIERQKNIMDENNQNYFLLKEQIHKNIFITAVAIKILKIDMLVYQKIGKSGDRRYSRYGFEIIKPIIHSLKHNLFKSDYELDTFEYIKTLQEQINSKYPNEIKVGTQKKFIEFDHEMTQIQALLEIGQSMYSQVGVEEKSILSSQSSSSSHSSSAGPNVSQIQPISYN